MARKRHNAEEIIGHLRAPKSEMGKRVAAGKASRKLGITEQTYRDEFLNREICYTLREALVVIERWRRTYNQVQPPSTSGYRVVFDNTLILRLATI